MAHKSLMIRVQLGDKSMLYVYKNRQGMLYTDKDTIRQWQKEDDVGAYGELVYETGYRALTVLQKISRLHYAIDNHAICSSLNEHNYTESSVKRTKCKSNATQWPNQFWFCSGSTEGICSLIRSEIRSFSSIRFLENGWSIHSNSKVEADVIFIPSLKICVLQRKHIFKIPDGCTKHA